MAERGLRGIVQVGTRTGGREVGPRVASCPLTYETPCSTTTTENCAHMNNAKRAKLPFRSVSAEPVLAESEPGTEEIVLAAYNSYV